MSGNVIKVYGRRLKKLVLPIIPYCSDKIEISEHALKKLHYYAGSTVNEISGLGIIDVYKDRTVKIYHVSDVFLFKQQSSAGSTSLNQADVAKFMADRIREGKDTSKLKCWWHSHGTGGVWWSSIDDDCCDGFESNDFMISLVVNYYSEILGRIDLYKPRLSYREIHPKVIFNVNKELKRSCEKEVREKNEEVSWNWKISKRYRRIKVTRGKQVSSTLQSIKSLLKS